MPPIPHDASTINPPPSSGATAEPPGVSSRAQEPKIDGKNDNGSSSGTNVTARVQLATLSRSRISARILKFLELYSQSGNVTHACAAAGITRETHYRKLRDDEVYRAAFAEAEAAAGQHLEDLAVQRVEDGTYDYQMHLALLRRFRPELYRERTSVDTTISVNLADRLEQARKRLNEAGE